MVGRAREGEHGVARVIRMQPDLESSSASHCTMVEQLSTLDSTYDCLCYQAAYCAEPFQRHCYLHTPHSHTIDRDSFISFQSHRLRDCSRCCSAHRQTLLLSFAGNPSLCVLPLSTTERCHCGVVMLSFLLELAVDAVPKTTVTRSEDQPVILDSTQPDWTLYILTIGAVAAGIHFFWTAYNPPSLPPPPPPASAATSATQMSTSRDKAWTLSELSSYNGTDPSKPLLMGCLGHVFDVSSGASFYGPGGPYGVFAGKDASRGLARMEIEYRGSDISDLTGSQLTTLQEWHDKFESKYPMVGRIVDDSQPNSGTAQAGSAGAAAGSSGSAGATSTDGAMGQTANPVVSASPAL